MKTITVALLVAISLAGFEGVASAQPAVTRMAYDQCLANPAAWDLSCTISIVVDGHDTVVANGIDPKWSADGSRIVFTGSTDPSEQYWLWNSWAAISVLNVADGSVVALTDATAYNNSAPVWSKDGSKIAFISQRDDWATELYVMDANGANPRRVTQNVGFTGTFGWSPDNGKFAIVSNRDGAPELYSIDADGSNLTRLTTNIGVTGAFAWSHDGTRIVFDCVLNGNADICAITSDGADFARLTIDPAKDSGAVFSPVDGRIAFVTERFGRAEIAVMDTNGVVTRVAPGIGAGQPVWSPDGNRLAFVTTTPSFYSGLCYTGGASNGDEFCMPVYGIDTVNADATALTQIASGDNPDWFRSLPGEPVAAFTYSCDGTACDFDATSSFDPDGTIASYEWQFGDGTTASGSIAHHDYATGNQYDVSLIVTDNSDATATTLVGVRANTAPVASFTFTCNGATCAFDGAASSDPDGTIVNYEWFFGGSWGGSATTASHTFATGTYSATLIVTDNGGATATLIKSVSVVNATPVASFTSTCNGATCTFDASASYDPDGQIFHYAWTFGDGAMRNDGPVVSHTFAPGSTYTVKLEVNDSYGSGFQSQTVTIAGINKPPVASFASACDRWTCNFNASASSDPDGTITTYSFNFGDGKTWTGAGYGPFHQYAADGTYTVTLTVTDNGGLTAQTSHVVTVTTPAMHVGDLDATRTMQQNAWSATVTIAVHNSSHQAIANAVVTGKWNDGSTASCTTNAGGQCVAAKSGIAKKTTNVTFTITNVALANFVYKPADNHDADGDSSGTAITVVKP